MGTENMEKEEKKNTGVPEEAPMEMDEASLRRMQEALKEREAEKEAERITPKKIGNIFFLGFFLFFVCLFASFVMGYVDQVTKVPRARAKKERLSGMLKDVLPPFDNDILSTQKTVHPKEVSSPSVVYTAQRKGKTVAYAVKVSTEKGYGGKMEALVSFSPEGKILSFVISEHSETPGLGAEVAERKEVRTIGSLFSPKKKKPFPDNLPPGVVLDQFRGRSVNEAPWQLRSRGGNIDGRSGATITSSAVTRLASEAALFLKERLKKEEKK